MLVIAAIDLKDGKVVRLLQGRYEEVTVYSHDPLETAKAWQKQGADRIHVVDLDAVLSGESKNITAIREIIEGVHIPVQIGGGLRAREDIAAVITIGAQWAILGSRACQDLDFVEKMITEFGEKILVSVDAKYGKVAIHGWKETIDIDDISLIKKLQGIGIKSFIYTDISRDGTLAGVNTERIRKVLVETGASIIYSGGVSSVNDIENLNVLGRHGLAGLIIGKALYEDKLNLIQVKRLMDKK